MSKILVVDDSETIQLLLKNVLTDQGFGVVSAWSAEEAMKALMGFRPDLILLDVKLPDIDGFELCRLLRKQPSNKMIPIIMITGTAIDAKQKAQGLRDGADDYLSKPFEPEELIERIRAVLRRVGRMPDPSAANTPFSGLLRETPPEQGTPTPESTVPSLAVPPPTSQVIPMPPAPSVILPMPRPITAPPTPTLPPPPAGLFPPSLSRPITSPQPAAAPTPKPATPPKSQPAPTPVPPSTQPKPQVAPTPLPTPPKAAPPPTPAAAAAPAPATTPAAPPVARVIPLPAFDPYDNTPSEHARGIGESLLAALCAPQRLPDELPPVSLFFLLLLLALCASNFLIVSDLTVKPVIVILLAVIMWGLLVSVLVVSCTLMGIGLPWKQGARLFSLAAMPMLLKLAGGEALAAATSLSPFLFTAGPALALPTPPWWMYRIDFYELWSLLLLGVLLRRQPRASLGKVFFVTLLVWAAGIFMAFALQRVNG